MLDIPIKAVLHYRNSGDNTRRKWRIIKHCNGSLYMPSKSALALKRMNIRSSEELLALCEAFPSAASFILNCPVHYIETIKRIIAPYYEPKDTFVAYGAVNPNR